MYVGSSGIRVVARPKQSLLGEHWGVQLPDGSVIHLTPAGAALVSFDAFLEGKNWRVVRQADPRRHRQILWRVAQALSQPQAYRLFDRNCESFANELLGDASESSQVQGVALIGFLLLLLRTM